MKIAQYDEKWTTLLVVNTYYPFFDKNMAIMAKINEMACPLRGEIYFFIANLSQ